jgi:hypothetical protein
MERYRSNLVGRSPLRQRIVTNNAARIRSIGAGESSTSHQARRHKRETQHGLNSGQHGEGRGPQRRRNHGTRKHRSANAYHEGKQHGDGWCLPVRHRSESNAPDYHPRHVRCETGQGGNNSWRVRDAEALQYLAAERRKRTQPVVMSDCEADYRATCGRCRDQSGAHSRPDR